MNTKTLFLMGMIALSLPTMTISASNHEMAVCGASEENGSAAYLHYYRYDSDTNSPNRPKHAPANYSYLPITWLEDGALYFQGTTSIPSVDVIVKDEDDVEVLATSIDVQQGVTVSVDVSSLGSGSYTLYIIVNDLEFYTSFEL